jgi:MoaA/NifB/PqqE/SkfB family radical SAM enzyme
MEFWRRIHWFLTTKCNEKCRFCFKPDFGYDPDNGKVLAQMLADNGVRDVVFTGGEPLLSRSLENTLEVLSRSDIDSSIHTNAMLLTPRRLSNLVPLTSEIAVPIDSTDRETQRYLRRVDCFPQVKRVLEQLQDTDLRIGIHTVATALNINDIPRIYDFIVKGKFDYWRIYEFNANIVRDRLDNVKRFREVERLKGKGATTNDGGVNCLIADFLLMEDYMSKYRDRRIQFVGFQDYDRAPYFFLNSNGDAYLATWFSQGRRPIGNILTEGFRKIRNMAIEEYSKGPLFDEEAFIETEQNQPLWARAAWEGNFFCEELEEVAPRYYERFRNLSRLYLNRIKKQGKAPRDAKLAII